MFRESESSTRQSGVGVQGSKQGALTSRDWIAPPERRPYFHTQSGASWTPVGHNEAVSWPHLDPLFRRRDPAAVEAHLRFLVDSGVTCLRLMLEYAHGEHRYLEKPIGRFVPNMVRYWDDLIAMCERVGMRLLLTPFDTFFTWIRWRQHPLNRANGGPCSQRGAMLTCPATREAIRNRLEFATRRWGGSPAVFGWDLWNEIHPAHGGGEVAPLAEFVDEVAPWFKALEEQLHGRRHPITVSVFGPELLKSEALNDLVFRHPELDFASPHLYESGTIDHPRDTVAPAMAVGRLMGDAIARADDGRPVFDSEHGPIHGFKDKKIVLSEPFDDAYFRHIQWAHLASGGAGGGMRWPNRHPHVLTPGMHRLQAALGRMLPIADWNSFDRRCWNNELRWDANVTAFGCGDDRQALLYLLRRDCLGRAGMHDPLLEPGEVTVRLPWPAGTCNAILVDPGDGQTLGQQQLQVSEDGSLALSVARDLLVLLRR
jgi:mannan endo-1,4-beta-mannosidase